MKWTWIFSLFDTTHMFKYQTVPVRARLEIMLSNPDGLNEGIEDSYLTTVKKRG